MIINIISNTRLYKCQRQLGYKYRVTIDKSTVESVKTYESKHKASEAANRFVAKLGLVT
ncbi:MAG: hypothetical protein GY928_16315 [Colwellia sp.]|nr:hypothetical protein [Colwellia sp.]